MSETAILGLAAVASPIILATLGFFFLRSQKKQDWAREDTVAAAAAARDEAAQVRQAEVAKKAETVAKTLLDSNSQTNGKLDVIHGLVNSSLTAAIQDTLDQTLLLRFALMAADRASPSPEGKEAIALADKKIADLTVTINDRNAAAANLAAEAAASGLGAQDAPHDAPIYTGRRIGDPS